MQVSSPTSSPVNSMPPRTFRQRHCAGEDWCRYFGGSVAFIGSAWCFSDNIIVPGSLLGIVGVSIVIVHITDKTCGARVKIIRAANEILQKYTTLFQKADATANQLEHIEEKHKDDHELLAKETTALTAETRDIEQGARNLQAQAVQYAGENAKLQSANLELRQALESQDKRMQELEQELEKFTEQNNRFHKELERITKAAAELNSTETKFQQDLTGFDAKIAQMQQIPALIEQMQKEKEELQQKIDQLQAQIEEYTRTKTSWTTDVQAIAQIQQTASATVGEIATKVEAQKEAFLASQQLLKQLIAQQQKTKKGDPP